MMHLLTLALTTSILLGGCSLLRTESEISSEPTFETHISPTARQVEATKQNNNSSPITQENIDPYAQYWDIGCIDIGCVMSINIVYGNPDDYGNLVIFVAINNDYSIDHIAFFLPENVDPSKRLFLVLADSNIDDYGNHTLIQDEKNMRLIPVQCDQKNCTSSVSGGIIPANDTNGQINLLEQFLEHRFLFLLFSTIEDEIITTGTTLSGFQEQYPQVLEDLPGE